MIIAFQIVLLFVIVISFLGTFGEKEDRELRNNMAFICVAATIAEFATLVCL